MTKGTVVFFRVFRQYVFITIGLFMFALGWTAFLLPAEIVGGGVTGIGALIFFQTGLPIGVSVIVLNGVLVLVAMRILGAKFGVSTIYGIATVSVFLFILQKTISGPIVNEPFMAALLGGIIGGAGIGMAFSNGGNSGGTDIVALIIQKYRNVSLGRIILYIDLIIIASSYFIFESLEKIVYGYVVMGVMAYTIDLVLEGAKQSYQFMIFSSNPEEIADRIANELGRGITALRGRGWFNQHESDVLVVICRKTDKQHIMRIVKESDPKAFISLVKVMGVYGENFDRIRL